MEPRAARNAMARQEARFSRPSAKSGSADLVSSRARWFDLPGHGEEIDLAGLDVFLGELKSFSVDQNARVVCVIRPLQQRRKVDGVANHSERPPVCRPDCPNYQIAGGEHHSHTEVPQIAAQTEDLG